MAFNGNNNTNTHTTNSNSNKNGNYCILSLDGGGVRSMIETVILKRIIEVYPTFLDSVDLIAGASAGGILALDLATGASNEKVGEFFTTIVPEIFHKSWLHEFTSLDSAIAASYTNEKLKDVLTKQFGNMTLKDLPKKVLIPSFQLDNHSSDSGPVLKPTVHTDLDNTEREEKEKEENKDCHVDNCEFNDIENDFEIVPENTNTSNNSYLPPPVPHHRRWAPRFFHNLKHSKTNDHLIVDVAMRTSAAPTYFPIYQGFVDGGVYANNPSLCAVTTAISTGIDMKNIVVLSISTGRDGKFVSPDQYGSGNWGLAQWAPTLIDMLLDSNVEISDFQCAQLLGTSYHRVDPLLTKNIDLDQPKFLPLLEEIANNVDLTSTFLWIENFWLKNNNSNSNNNNNNNDKPVPIYTPTTSPSYISPTSLINNVNSFSIVEDNNFSTTTTTNNQENRIRNNNRYNCNIQ